MKKILVLIIFFSFVPLSSVFALSVTIANDGTGNYTTDGVQDQIEINQALDFVAAHPDYDTVFLKGPAEYVIDDSLLISDDTILTGDSSVILRLKDNAGWWEHFKPLIGQKNRVALDAYGHIDDHIRNVEIYGFQIDTGEQAEPSGDTYLPIIHFYNPENVSIHDMVLRGSKWDSIRLSSPAGGALSHSRIFQNEIYNSGHEGVSIVNLTHVNIFRNKIFSTRTNCGIRIKDSDHIFIYENIIGNSLAKNPSGYAGILIENRDAAMNQAEIYKNYIFGKNGGIHLEGHGNYATGFLHGVHIHHNTLFKTKSLTNGSGFFMGDGIKVNGYQDTLIEHNVIEQGTDDGIVYEGDAGGGNDYRTYVRNNIIVKNGGFGINNKNTNANTFFVNNNIVYQNRSGNYHNVVDMGDIHEDPLFAEEHTTINKWHHVVATYDKNTEMMALFVDGNKMTERKISGFGDIGTNTKPLYFGAYRGITHWFRGYIDEVSIWSRALSNREVELLFHDGNTGSITSSLNAGIEGHFKLNQTWSNDIQPSHFTLWNATAQHSQSDFISPEFSALFELDTNGDGEYISYSPANFSTANGITLSAWVKTSVSDDAQIQTIINKGNQGSNDHIWLYLKGENLVFEIGNETVRKSISTYLIHPWRFDYHLLSRGGRWNGGRWVVDVETSPGIDQGDPLSDYRQEPEPNGDRVNIGLYGNTREASKSSVEDDHMPSLHRRSYRSKMVSKMILAKIFGKKIYEKEVLKQKKLEKKKEGERNENERVCSFMLTRLLKRGIRGEDVRKLQVCMNALGHPVGIADGIYGPHTYQGVTAFQRAMHLKYIDGIVGPETMKAINRGE